MFRRTPVTTLTLLATCIAWTTAAAMAQGDGAAPASKPASPEASRPSQPGATAGPHLKADRILFLGNSITLHGPSAAIGWTGNWGMAASAAEKDYVHIVVDSLAKRSGRKPEVLVENIADFERHYDTYDLAQLKKHFDFKADVAVVAIGENVPALVSEDSRSRFRQSVIRLLTALKKSGRPAIFVRSCFWPDKTKDEVLEKACRAADAVFVDMSNLGKDESNFARSERSFAHAGVAGHPGDKGMKAIADALLKAMDRSPFVSR